MSLQPWIVELSPGTWLSEILDQDIETLDHRLDADNARALVARCLATFEAAGIEHGGCLESAIDAVLARLC